MKKYLVFVVEDDEDDWLFLKEAFGEVGCVKAIRQFQTPQLLLVKLAALPVEQLPDLVVLDHQTPGRSGSETVEAIRKNKSLDPVSLVVYSTAMPAVLQKRLAELGVDLCLQKGRSQQELIQHVQQFCELLNNKRRAA